MNEEIADFQLPIADLEKGFAYSFNRKSAIGNWQ
jgi:hypothetical protein